MSMGEQKIFYNPSPSDVLQLQKVSQWTAREEQKGTMVFRSLPDMEKFSERGDVVILFVNGVEAASASKTHMYRMPAGPFGLFRRHIHEIGAVATEEGYQRNGFAKDVVLEAVRQQLLLRKRILRREILKPRVVAMVQIDNQRSNQFFGKLGSLMKRNEMPDEAYTSESVGEGNHSHDFNTYDITNSIRRS